MRYKKSFISAFSMLIFMATAFTISTAQSEAPRFEAGAHLPILRISEIDENNVGVGGRFTVNLNSYLAAETEFNYFPGDSNSLNQDRFLGVAGIKAGVRGDRIGFFGKVRPGVMRFNQVGIVCQAVLPAPFPCEIAAGQTKFALDIGGVAEFYTSKRTMVRVDVGDTMIRFDRYRLDPPTTNLIRDRFYSHNLQINLGFGVRF